MTPDTRSRTPAVELERAIVDAAARVLAEDGPDALAVRRIAAEAGVAPMGIYNRFGGKPGVVAALFRRGFDALREALELASGPDPIAELADGCERYRRFALAHPAEYAVMFDHAVPDFEPDASCRLHADGAFGVLVAAVERAVTAGSLAGEPVVIAQQIWAACHGAVSLELRELGFVDDRAALYSALTAALLRGLGLPPA